MKAESIEQIREHLEKGGRVICEGSGRIVTGTSFCGERIILNSGHWVQFNSAHWQLLPLEEKEPVDTIKCPHCLTEIEYIPEGKNYCCDRCGILWSRVPRPSRTRPRTDQEWREYAESKLPSKEQLRELAKTNPPPQEWFDEEPVNQKSKDAIDVEFIHAACTHERKSCLVMSSVSQMCPNCAERHRLVTNLRSSEREDHGTQKGQEERFRDSQKERMQRIRTRLLHGMWPEMPDLLAWWEATTGERIEWGRRCERCGCNGWQSVRSEDRGSVCTMSWVCDDCQGSGYSVRPTWMEEGK